MKRARLTMLMCRGTGGWGRPIGALGGGKIPVISMGQVWLALVMDLLHRGVGLARADLSDRWGDATSSMLSKVQDVQWGWGRPEPGRLHCRGRHQPLLIRTLRIILRGAPVASQSVRQGWVSPESRPLFWLSLKPWIGRQLLGCLLLSHPLKSPTSTVRREMGAMSSVLCSDQAFRHSRVHMFHRQAGARALLLHAMQVNSGVTDYMHASWELDNF